MKPSELGHAWLVATFYVSYVLIYIVPLLACSANSQLCDPSVQGNFLSVSRVIRQTYWNTSFAFTSALFIASTTYILIIYTPSHLARVAVIGSAICGIVPAVVPLNEHEGWDVVDIVHTAFAVCACVFQLVYVAWIVSCKPYAPWRLPLAVAAVAFAGALVALAAATGARWGANSASTATKLTYFVSEYVISASLYCTVRTVLVANQIGDPPSLPAA